MSDDESRRDAPTRRECVRYGGAALGASLLAGCTGEGNATPAGTATESTATDTPEETSTAEAASTETGSYSVTMAPMGKVTFPAVPETVYTGLPHTADMAIAAGQADAIEAVYHPEYHGTLLDHFYERLDGVSFEWDGLTNSWELGKEGFYELDADVHLTDPAYASTLETLDQAAVTEIEENVAPWFGNYYSDRHRSPPEAWADQYEYYDLWEIFGRVAQVFRAGDAANELAAVNESLRSTVADGLPPSADRPTVALTFPGEDDTFWIYRLNADGFLTAHTRPLGAVDAFADADIEGAQKQVGPEAMLEADPDVILVLFTLASSYSIEDVRARLADHDVTSEIAAVQDGRVHAQGARYQGPVMNLFQLEMTAKQLYPERFGPWPGYEDGEPYPEIPAEERLFDRQRVARAITAAAEE